VASADETQARWRRVAAREITLASRNPGKLAELRRLAGPALDLRLLPGSPAPPVVEEDDDTYLGNARKKAATIARFLGAPALADDSGLEVDGLGGAPGVHSARYGGADLDDRTRCLRLLDALAGSADRRARFRCVLVLAEDDVWVSAEGALEGEIARKPRGRGGFGYDPIFVVPALGGRTLAEVGPEEKDRVSHRAAALRALLAKLLGASGGAP
jgi:XTP/dITP diphosphohydrolase